VRPQAPGEHGEVEHQGRVGEDELAEIDDDVGLRADRAGQGWTPDPLRIAVFVTAAAEGRRLVVKVNDAGKPTQSVRPLTSPDARFS